MRPLPSYSLGLGPQAICGLALDCPQFGAGLPPAIKLGKANVPGTGVVRALSGERGYPFWTRGPKSAPGMEASSFFGPEPPLPGYETF